MDSARLVGATLVDILQTMATQENKQNVMQDHRHKNCLGGVDNSTTFRFCSWDGTRSRSALKRNEKVVLPAKSILTIIIHIYFE
jgi:hypothetical protein